MGEESLLDTIGGYASKFTSNFDMYCKYITFSHNNTTKFKTSIGGLVSI